LTDMLYAPGQYELPFDAKGIPAGIYLYRIEMDHFRTTRKMTVMK
jgi:hypothetical protein